MSSIITIPLSDSVSEINTIEEFRKFKEVGVVVIDVYATWCQPCMNFAPIFQEISGYDYDVFEEKVAFYKMDADNPNLTQLKLILQIKQLPTFCLFKNGSFIEHIKGKYDHKTNILMAIKENTTPIKDNFHEPLEETLS